MARRALALLCGFNHFRNPSLNQLLALKRTVNPLLHLTPSSSFGVFCKVIGQGASREPPSEANNQFHYLGSAWIHVGPALQSEKVTHEVVEPDETSQCVVPVSTVECTKVKRKKLKGKRAVVRWLKCFRWKKKKEHERMTAEEKILYKLKKARNKEARLVESLRKIDPQDPSEATHDPEILTPEEHFYFLKMGHRSRNYVPVGRRGIYQGVILNMHLHWKKHQTLKVIVKTFSPEEVREIAAELAKLSGGIVLDIHEEDTIIMYRGKNYVQPPTEIMSPKITLSRKKALDKSKYRDALRAVRKFIPRLEQDLEDLQKEAKKNMDYKNPTVSEDVSSVSSESNKNREISTRHRLEELIQLGEKDRNHILSDNLLSESTIHSDSEVLSDIFDSDSEEERDEKEVKPLYMDEIERLPSKVSDELENFEGHLKHVSAVSRNLDSSKEGVELLELDEVDRIFLRAGSLLRKRRR